MTEWEFLSVALSLILGLAVALVLTSALAVFRARRDARLAAVPIAWAVYIFVSQLQYWWGPVRALDALDRITGPVFIVMILLLVLIFLAGGLVLPSGAGPYPPDLATYFERDGRWGVLIYGVYWLVGLSLHNVWIHGAPLNSLASLTVVMMMMLAAVACWVPKGRTAATVLFAPVLVLNTFAASDLLQSILDLG